MLKMTGKPCPTCGVTTSFVLSAHGRFAEALVNQPFGLVVFLLVVGGLGGLGITLFAGRSWTPILARVDLTLVVLVLLALMLLSWAYKWSVM